ncbi:hypothetical protein N658DRAFT_489421 [Parathielavia hyrcaniae]|uniref:2EXR domain-containing protein n=1 Tax=Parathielavia hyrcaniae TaxID=113614 RepID=A0AAN6PSW3_9PEZI|nr:hypothetical protein N658DRAFT_489421 [Parathielavia hyrcaniae]
MTVSFTNLPLEIKQQIWQLALHAAVAEPEVCIVWPIHQIDYDQVSHPLLVDTAFPVLMHVCREWRDFVITFSSSTRSPVRFRFSRQAGCRVPYRAFRGDTDVLFASMYNFEKAVQYHALDLEPGVGRQTLETVRHLAVDWVWWNKAASWLPELVFRACRDLEKVSVVFPSSRRAVWKAFQAPARRCKLRPVEGADDLSTVAESSRTPGKVVSVQSQVDYGQDSAEDEAVFSWQNELDLHELELGEPPGAYFAAYTGSAWDKEREKLCLEYEAAAFVQFKRSEDGSETWVEACEDRLFEEDADGVRQEPPILTPEQPTRNPEEWRVNDDDDYAF